MRLASSLTLLLFSSLGCSSPGPSANGDAGPGVDGVLCVTCVDASTDRPPVVVVKAILGQVCSQDGCHLTNAGNLPISGDNVFASVIDVPSSEMPNLLRIKPGDPAQSYLYRKLACEGGIDGSCMPPGGTLPSDIVRSFHDWIEAGAPTN